eukprot:CAMPEP_0198122400 /NCGR_PEP_ID=MMETSP1442-20131203/34723_1 /TAXON_ID= /ORGANISM="Craspedostauros australis, Strain CCMP3328" /LENGTH=56 /DNA_ID=CAMNT_0043781407 /DNA_START=59 /DNA_END=225 /DNA_ORIENTATION=+
MTETFLEFCYGTILESHLRLSPFPILAPKFELRKQSSPQPVAPLHASIAMPQHSDS